MSPLAAVEWLEKEMFPVFPLGEIKNTIEGAAGIQDTVEVKKVNLETGIEHKTKFCEEAVK
jgi:hypothetical protein